VVGLNLAKVDAGPLDRALTNHGLSGFRYEIRVPDVNDLALEDRRFDLIVSNGVFEHVLDMKGALEAFRRLLKSHGRVAIFADGLWYSSIGGISAPLPGITCA
jgi:cyclopropane fatty-acyl-phospholipid synthase-like methyltransferase